MSVILAADALAKTKDKQVDLIVSNVSMPNMDGIQLTSELRSLTEYKFTLILRLTTESGRDKNLRVKQLGQPDGLFLCIKPLQKSCQAVCL